MSDEDQGPADDFDLVLLELHRLLEATRETGEIHVRLLKIKESLNNLNLALQVGNLQMVIGLGFVLMSQMRDAWNVMLSTEAGSEFAEAMERLMNNYMDMGLKVTEFQQQQREKQLEEEERKQAAEQQPKVEKKKTKEHQRPPAGMPDAEPDQEEAHDEPRDDDERI